jgi:hypothetical protein
MHQGSFCCILDSVDSSLLGLETWNGYGNRGLHAIPLARFWIYRDDLKRALVHW